MFGCYEKYRVWVWNKEDPFEFARYTPCDTWEEVKERLAHLYSCETYKIEKMR